MSIYIYTKIYSINSHVVVYEKNNNTEINSTRIIINHQEFDKMLLSYTNTHSYKIIALIVMSQSANIM